MPANFAGRVFFGAGGPMGGIPHAGRHRPEQRQRHDQDEAVEPSGKPDLAVFEPEAAALEIQQFSFWWTGVRPKDPTGLEKDWAASFGRLGLIQGRDGGARQ